MKQLTGNQVRQMFLDYFKSKGHMIEPGASLIPHNDPRIRHKNSGTVPFFLCCQLEIYGILQKLSAAHFSRPRAF